MQSEPSNPGGAPHQEAVSLQCLQCGGTQFTHPANVKDDDQLSCTACGAVATIAQLRDHAISERARQLAAGLFTEGLKGVKGWKKLP
ncbi:ECs_2282 family putative zinc-binding protein [Pseudaquabacterium pictum]|uniref:ECs_2282 family putative zinc-binding protein n=1 Tax=Pseudaquabacterium pictum TaxID=2315236 RepID=UPI0026D1E62E